MPRPSNPIEALAEEFSDVYVELVLQLAVDIAPYRPWWHEELSPDAQVWRWQKMRGPIVEWLAEISPFMGWPDLEAAIGGLRDLFTGPIEQAIPGELLIDERADGLKELVQSAGPREAAKHIRRVEAMLARRATAAALMTPTDPYGAPPIGPQDVQMSAPMLPPPLPPQPDLAPIQ